ncbi:hypothetical protein D9619_005494 [Psilocybe cf. subviscida]|uniref:CAP-Gly domain-containing protein n=1 Tax=Psilocybe cf. subviscida TaxID=2480587 RepID=A0A8H5BWW9_9AGAR|nr:hypothetical protein D9619_005494 [Psilocybe cf. subviscida]
MEQPSVGVRISHNGHLGTIRYVGPVDNTRGVWLGVEWDDADRGKHDGSKDGKHYFSCRFSTSGSFIRPTSHISYGVSFIDALSSKYIDTLHGSHTQENIILGSSAGAIKVEAVSLDKIRQKFARLDRLREVSLDNAYIVKGDPPGQVTKTCPNIRGLDLSQNLLPSWETVAQITQELPALERLSLNRNRLQMPVISDLLPNAFRTVTEIQLNDTLMTWTDMRTITAFMPHLQVIEMGYNRLTRLAGDKPPTTFMNTTVQFINLDSNYLSEWTHLCTSLKSFQSLARVVLASNFIEAIPIPNDDSNFLPGLKYLSLSDNRLSEWGAIDALARWCPSLESMVIKGNPLVAGDESGKRTRPLVVARIPSLTTLDGASISSRERTDSELFYISSIMHAGVASDEVRSQQHPRWTELCAKYGRPDEVQNVQKVQNKLSNQLIDLKLHRYAQTMKQRSDAIVEPPEAVLRVLPSMSLRILKLKIHKTLKLNPRQAKLTFWLYMGNGALTELDNEQDGRDLDWLGIDNDSFIIYHVE